MSGYVGLDLSLTGSGVMHSSGEWALIGQDGITQLSVIDQIKAIERLADAIAARVDKWQPAAIVIEQLDMARSYGGAVQRVMLWTNVVDLLVRERCYRMWVAASALGKIYATGKAGASKGQVIDAVARLWPQLPTGGDDNLADAAVYCAMAAAIKGHPLVRLPETHTRALTKVLATDEAPPTKTRPTVRAAKRATPLDM